MPSLPAGGGPQGFASNSWQQLLEHIAHLDPGLRSDLEPVAQQTLRRHQELQENLKALQESLDTLRISVKYLVFDLEATRRENAELRRQLRSPQSEE